MALFHPHSNGLFATALGAVVLMLVAVTAWGVIYYSSDYYTRVGFIQNQPVPFSHKHHVGGLGLDCRYCHTSVEQSSFAGIPSPSTCMNCHTHIWPQSPMLEPVRKAALDQKSLEWNRVHRLPDYVYFDHSIHVAKGIGCTECHGKVNEMPLTWRSQDLKMAWCLDCHRNPESKIRPQEKVFDPHLAHTPPEQAHLLAQKYHVLKKTDCYTCHR